MLLTHRLGLIDLELGVSLEAENLFELEHVTRPVILQQDHLHIAVRIETGQCCSKFANRHGSDLIRHALVKIIGTKKSPRRNGPGHE
jgi:hypothetical protein